MDEVIFDIAIRSIVMLGGGYIILTLV